MKSSMEQKGQDFAVTVAESNPLGIKRRRIDVKYMSQRLTLDVQSGRLIWNEREVKTPHHKTWNSKYPGKFADKKFDKKGYRLVMVDECYYKAHRIAWAIFNDAEPGELDIDHINLCKHDNRPCNLRTATSSENKMNMTLKKNNTSGYKGVSWFSREKKFVAQIWVGGHKKVIGYFDSAEDAAEAYAKNSAILHGEFGRIL